MRRSETVFWINDRTAYPRGKIEANKTLTLTTILSHEWWIRDDHTDRFRSSPNRNRITDETCLYNVKITSDTRTEYIIPKRNCYDRSGHCPFWNRSGAECSKNPGFMHKTCPLTCGLCQKEDVVDKNEKQDSTQDGEQKHNNKDEERKFSSGNDEL